MADPTNLRARAKFFLTLAQQARDGGSPGYSDLLSERATQLFADADAAAAKPAQQQQQQIQAKPKK